MSIAQLISDMEAAGAPLPAIMIAVRAIEAEQAKDQERRDKRAEQKRIERERRATVARHGGDTGATVADAASREEYNTTRAQTVIPVGISNDIPPIVNPQLPTVVTPPKSKSPSPKEILSEVVSEKTAADVVAHRKALRKPLTPRAAELLAKSLAASGDAEAAAATMIERGWQGYRADWDTPRSNARAGPSEYPGTKKTEFMAFYEQLCEETKDHGKQAESEVSNGNVLSLPVVRHENGCVQGDAGELFAVSPRIPAGNR